MIIRLALLVILLVPALPNEIQAVVHSSLTQLASPGPLTALHAPYDGDCLKCHAAGGGVPDRLCLDCHKEIRTRIEQNKGYHAKLDKKCFECHPDHLGRQFDVVPRELLKPEVFRHQVTGFPLEGKHAELKCDSCHRERSYLKQQADCTFCHQSPHKGQFAATSCADCHSAAGRWMPDRFKHERSKFKLEGAHAEADCGACHGEGRFRGRASQGCADCHQEPHEGQFAATPCADCHSATGSWVPDRFKHERSKFKLEGAHAEADCSACHGEGRFRGRASQGCADCHQEPHEGQFAATPCADCHSATGSWMPDRFKHERSKFKLEGAHAEADCGACHGEGRFRGRASQGCADCHQEPHEGQFAATPCADCHSATGDWVPDRFKHERSKFKLEGAHAEADCGACHGEGRFRGRASQGCADCHQEPHEGQFAATPCADCHSATGGWMPDRFKHERSKFKLEGAHAEADCGACHGEGRFRGRASQGCADCHVDPHAGLRGGDCTRCHNPMLDWDLEMSTHREGPFPLQGRHARLACNECHRDGQLTRLDSNCTSCHRDPHRNQFGQSSCGDCHSPEGWQPPTFRHIEAGFVLDGRHRTTDCRGCHPGRNYRNTPIDCESCHTDDLRRTRNPNHRNAGISGDCRQCHNTSSWQGAIFNHVFYRLAGPHNNAMRCNACHVGGTTYNLSASRCTGCHPRPLHAGHSQPDGDTPNHTVPHLHGHEPCARCHFTDIWQNVRFHSMGGN